MSFLGKAYTFQRHENFDAWLRATGVPEEKISAIINEKSSTKIVKDGDDYIITQTTQTGDKVTPFKSGVQFDDKIAENLTLKNSYTVDGNTVTQVLSGPHGPPSTFRREYNGDDLVVYVSGGDTDVTAKRFYKA